MKPQALTAAVGLVAGPGGAAPSPQPEQVGRSAIRLDPLRRPGASSTLIAAPGSPKLASSARFNELPEKTRDELRLIHNRRMSLQEVAIETGSNIEAVKKRMARARLLLEATSTRDAARRFVEHESLSTFGGNLEKGLPDQLITANSPSREQSGGTEDGRSVGLREEGVVYTSAAAYELQPGWRRARWRNSRPLTLLVTACAVLLLMVVLLSLVKLCTDLLTLVGPHLGA